MTPRLVDGKRGRNRMDGFPGGELLPACGPIRSTGSVTWSGPDRPMGSLPRLPPGTTNAAMGESP